MKSCQTCAHSGKSWNDTPCYECTGTALVGMHPAWTPIVAPAVAEKTTGIKFDTDKLDYTLLPWDSIEDIVKVLEFGARKYARDNWKNVEAERYVKAAFRHLVAYQQGERSDQETGLSHLAHLGCCVLFLLSMEKNNVAIPTSDRTSALD